MIKLIKNELYKIFHKKSTYIIMGIAILFAILVNFIYSNNALFEEVFVNYEFLEDAEDKINNFNIVNDTYENLAYYETEADAKKLINQYEKDDWQYFIIGTNYYTIANEYFMSTHGMGDLKVKKEKYEKANVALKNDDWKYFVNEEITTTKEEIAAIKASINNNDNREQRELKDSLFVQEETLKLLEYRIDNNVIYGNDYLNQAIRYISLNLMDVAKYINGSKEDKIKYEESAKLYYESKYALEKKEDTISMTNLRYVMKNLFEEYSFIILIFVIMIAGGIVSEEFNKGTIKALLITPYNRTTILLAKFLTSLFMIIIFIVYLVFVELLVGGLFFGFSSLSIPVVVYNLSTMSIEVVNIFKYILLNMLASLPKIVILVTLAFGASTVLSSTSFAIAITFCLMIASSVINSFALNLDLKFLNYFISTNWDFTCFLFGGSSSFGVSFIHASVVCLIYFGLMLSLTFIVFKRKDIKNI